MDCIRKTQIRRNLRVEKKWNRNKNNQDKRNTVKTHDDIQKFIN